MRPEGPPPDRPDNPPKPQTTSGGLASSVLRAPAGRKAPASRYFLFFGIVALGLAADLATKHVMFARWDKMAKQFTRIGKDDPRRYELAIAFE